MKEGNTTLSVPREFANHLREDVDGNNDYERIHNWAKKEFGYKNSITNRDLDKKLQELNEKLNDFEQKPEDSYNNSITKSDIRQAVEEALPSGMF